MYYRDTNDYELVYMARESEEAFGIILTKYKPLIVSLALKYKRYYSNINLDLDDLIQEGRIAIYRALNSYDENNALFYTFLILCIKRAMYIYVRKFRTENNMKLNNDCKDIETLEYALEDKNIKDPDEMINDLYFYSKIIEFKNNLTDKNAQIFELRCNNFKYKEIAELLDMSSKSVDNAMLTIKKKLRKFLLKL